MLANIRYEFHLKNVLYSLYQIVVKYTAPVGAVCAIFCACMGFEICCYAGLGFAVWLLSTNRIENYECNQISDVYNSLKNFVRSGNRKEKVLRIIAVNYGLDMQKRSWNTKTIKDYIDGIIEDNKYEELTKLKLRDLRNNCENPQRANLFPGIWQWLEDTHKELYEDLEKDRNLDFENWMDVGLWVLFLFVIFIFSPIMIVAKLVQIIYPWIIVGYLGYNKLLFTNKIDSFQMVMLMIYIGLQLILVLLGIYVYRIHHLMWHFEIGNRADWWQIKQEELLKSINEFYDKCAWFPAVEKIILNRFGGDIGNIIIMYCRNFELDENAEKLEEILESIV